jgi:hypothetical protein
MSAALILYGSRARGDARVGSDIDIILAEEGDHVGRPRANSGISIHQYGKTWLVNQARIGNLFAYHVAHEGRPLLDELHFLQEMRTAACLKASYGAERRTAALIMRLLLERDWQSNAEIRRRYFWALRTMLITATADRGEPAFASRDLEVAVRIDGLTQHIDSRNDASFNECALFGCETMRRFGVRETGDLQGEALRDLLIRMGGIAADSVRIFEMKDVEKGSELAIYM